MKPENARIDDPVRTYFLGSGRIAVPVLGALLDALGVELVGVGTQPDRPAGRHRTLHPTPIGEAASTRGLTVEKPQSVNSPGVLDSLSALKPELIVVAAFGQILRHDILNLPEFGCLNVHASLLPRHRGASPVNAAILAGDKETGISFMRMEKGLDTGPVYRRLAMPLDGTERASELEMRLGRLAADGIVGCVVDICRQGLQPTPQDDSLATKAPKLKKTDGAIDWRLPAAMIERMARAFDPWPRAFFVVQQGRRRRRLQVTAATVTSPPLDRRVPGEIMQADNDGWTVACGQQALRLDRVIPEGKREMTGPDFLRGAQLTEGDRVLSAHETIS